MNICDYGCEKEAKHQFKNGKWCCSSHWSRCSNKKIKFKGKNNTFYGKKHTYKSKEKMSISSIGKGNGRIPWNKGLKNCFDESVIKKISDGNKGKIPWNKGMKNCFDNKTLQSMSKNREGDKNGSWKGGYGDIPLYETYKDKLTVEEKPKQSKYDSEVLTVICTQCKIRFTPSTKDVWERVRCLKGSQNGESRLYCSDECKQQCDIYWKNPNSYLTTINNKFDYTQEENQTFRNYVLERDNYICQYCGEKATNVHHERPQKLEPFHALDPDYAWSCCSKCHYERGHKKGTECSTGKLANKICL